MVVVIDDGNKGMGEGVDKGRGGEKWEGEGEFAEDGSMETFSVQPPQLSDICYTSQSSDTLCYTRQLSDISYMP